MYKAIALENTFAGLFSKSKSVSGTRKVVETGQAKYWFAISLIAINAVLFMSYVYGVNKYASSGYEIKTLQNKLAVLTDANKKTNLKISEASSMLSIQSDFLSSNFVPAGTPKFLEVSQLTLR